MDFENMNNEELYALAFRKNGSLVKELAEKYTPRSLFSATLPELEEIKGVGETSARQIKAILELSRRAVAPNNYYSEALNNPQDVASLLMPKMQLLDREHFIVVSLTTKNRIISIETVSVGSLNSSIVHQRELYKNPIKNSAASIIAVHNHPSGDPTPSREDLEITKRISDAGKILGIPLIDHIVIGDGAYYSFKEKGLLE